jgi:hypothetical protein
MEGLGYDYDDTLRGHDIAEWSNEQWDAWYAGEKAYWERVEAEPKTIQQRASAALHWAWSWPNCAWFNLRSYILDEWWWAFERKILGRDPVARLDEKLRRRKFLLQK